MSIILISPQMYWSGHQFEVALVRETAASSKMSWRRSVDLPIVLPSPGEGEKKISQNNSSI